MAFLPPNSFSVNDFYFAVVEADDDGELAAFRGTAFAVASGGDLASCRHVVTQVGDGRQLGVLDQRGGGPVFRPIGVVQTPADQDLDLAFLPNALNDETHADFLPIIEPELAHGGVDVRAYGFYPYGNPFPIEGGMYSGDVVAHRYKSEAVGSYPALVLPFAVLEGMSGSPLTTYHNGMKVTGVCCGNETHRIVADEILDIEEGDTRYKELTQRVVERGLALHASALIEFLEEVDATGWQVSATAVEGSGT
jgi:hypothetical protein